MIYLNHAFKKWVRISSAEFILEDGKYFCAGQREIMSKSITSYQSG
jgi:hypothetical protein